MRSFTCTALLRNSLGVLRIFGYGALTLYGAIFQSLQLIVRTATSGSHNPGEQASGLGCSAFARHY